MVALPVFPSTSATYTHHPETTLSSWFLLPQRKRRKIRDACGDQTAFLGAASPVPPVPLQTHSTAMQGSRALASALPIITTAGTLQFAKRCLIRGLI